MKNCAEKCHKLLKIQNDYFEEILNKEENPIFQENMPIKLNNDEENEEFEEEIQRYNAPITKTSNFEIMRENLRKTLKTTEKKEVF